LGENALGQALGTKAAAGVLRDLEHDFVHTLNLPQTQDPVNQYDQI
jgi:hypothetical protein